MISLIECFIMNLYQLSRIGFSYLLLPRVNNNLHFHHSDGYGGFLRVPLRVFSAISGIVQERITVHNYDQKHPERKRQAAHVSFWMFY